MATIPGSQEKNLSLHWDFQKRHWEDAFICSHDEELWPLSPGADRGQGFLIRHACHRDSGWGRPEEVFF